MENGRAGGKRGGAKPDNLKRFCYQAIRSEEKIQALQAQIDYLEGQNKALKSRLSALEEKV